MQPTPVFLPREFHGQRSLVGYIQSKGSQRVGHDWTIDTFIFPNLPGSFINPWWSKFLFLPFCPAPFPNPNSLLGPALCSRLWTATTQCKDQDGPGSQGWDELMFLGMSQTLTTSSAPLKASGCFLGPTRLGLKDSVTVSASLKTEDHIVLQVECKWNTSVPTLFLSLCCWGNTFQAAYTETQAIEGSW